MEDVISLYILLNSYNCHAGCIGPGINFNMNRLDITLFPDPINEPDGKWELLMNPCPVFSQKLSCSGRMTRH
jgi:hypothetical protein